eukprot:12475488-Alexandrium_andersonii.AAC.1
MAPQEALADETVRAQRSVDDVCAAKLLAGIKRRLKDDGYSTTRGHQSTESPECVFSAAHAFLLQHFALGADGPTES